MSFEKMYIVWICAAVLFGIFESLTAQLVSVWFVIGAVAALSFKPCRCRVLRANHCLYCGFGFNAFDYTSLG